MLQTLAPLRPILFVGESGTAKTTVIQKYLHGLDNSVSTKLNINFSSKTTSADVQTNIESNVDRRSGMIFYHNLLLYNIMLFAFILFIYVVLFYTIPQFDITFLSSSFLVSIIFNSVTTNIY